MARVAFLLSVKPLEKLITAKTLGSFFQNANLERIVCVATSHENPFLTLQQIQ